MPTPPPLPALSDPFAVPAAAASGCSTHTDTRTAAVAAAAQLQAGLGAGGADLVLAFGSFHHRAAFGDAVGILRAMVEARCVVGVTAEWVVGRGRECESLPGLSALAVRVPGLRCHPVRLDVFDGPPQVWADDFVAERLALDDHELRGILLFADPFSIHAPSLLTRLNTPLARRRIPIVGGLASGSSQPGANVLVLDRTVAATGAVGVSLAGPIRFDPLVSPGCRPIGRTFVITKSEGNLILELSGVKALDALKQVIEELPEQLKAATRDGLLVGFAADEYRDRFGRGDFLLRGVLGADLKRNALIVGDAAKVGRTVRFHLRDRTAADEDLDLLLDREQIRDPALAVFLATCSGRGRRLFGSSHHDAQAFARRLGDPPLAGLFAAGEIGPIGDRSWLHGHSVSAAILRHGLGEAPDA